MQKWLVFVVGAVLSMAGTSGAKDPGQTFEFSNRDGNRVVRAVTPGEAYSEVTSKRKLPIRNPRIMAQVMWVDRAHEYAVPENVSITPDGSGIFCGWWLNNERYAAYSSAGLETPIWRYYQENPWPMPVGASNSIYVGTGVGLPAFIWDRNSPLFIDQIVFDPGYDGRGVSFSGDGSLVAAVAAKRVDDGILVVFDLAAQDTVFTRHFDPARGLYGVDFSHDGTRVVVSGYDLLYVYSIPQGDLLGSLYNYSQNIARISGDGTRIVTGTFDGYVFLYEWNGAGYDIRWTNITLDDWVTAVDISTDGSTVASGTLDFEGGWISGGKFNLWDAESGDRLIDYDEYGDCVSSVGLSADGRYAIAGSWGQYGGTFGDVVTCFIRDTSTPIFKLLDDIDESGSIYAVAISESGHYAAAGGKEVHAREFGNGGMLYSIKVNDPLVHDVATSSIDEPGEFVNPGDVVTPTASFINVGASVESFLAACSVTNLEDNNVIYSSSFNITDLASFGTSRVFFEPTFSVPVEGRYRLDFTADLEGDQDTANNTLSLILRSWHDVRAESIISPYNEITVNWQSTPAVIFKNMGSYTETFEVLLDVTDSTGATVWSSYNTVYDLAPYAFEELQFDPWVPDAAGTYRAAFDAQLPGDAFPENNMSTKSVRVSSEMIYDDGVLDRAFWVGPYPESSNRKFAQRFRPIFTPPYTITSLRFFQPDITYGGIFDYIAVDFEAPDGTWPNEVSGRILTIADPNLPGPNNWATFNDLNYAVETSTLPLWVVIHWADNTLLGPYIGADRTGVVDQQSYWYTNQNGWNLWQWDDWMIRMTLREGISGIESEIISGLPARMELKQNYPNPFNPSTSIEFALPNAGNVRLDIYNSLGQVVRQLVNSHYDAGYHLAAWNGKSDSGSEMASGVYYYRLTCGDFRISRKMLMMK